MTFRVNMFASPRNKVTIEHTAFCSLSPRVVPWRHLAYDQRHSRLVSVSQMFDTASSSQNFDLRLKAFGSSTFTSQFIKRDEVPERYCWGFKCSVMLRPVGWYEVADVSNHSNVSIFRFKRSKSTLLELRHPKDVGTTLVRIISNFLLTVSNFLLMVSNSFLTVSTFLLRVSTFLLRVINFLLEVSNFLLSHQLLVKSVPSC
jgi:hypothetical protein